MPARINISKSKLLSIPKLLRKGWTNKQIGEEIGISASVISRIITGEDRSRRWPEFDRRLAAAQKDLRNFKICTKCGEKLPRTSHYFQTINRGCGFEPHCLTCKRAAGRARYAKTRMAVLSHYSGGIPCCACCGETETDFLSIDHIDGGGAQHRHQFRAEGFSSIYAWAKANGYPSGFRVLCMNCNSSLGFHGYCPHQREGTSNL